MSSPSSNCEESAEETQKKEIRDELSSMSFEELMKLKEELGSKVYKDAVFGVDTSDTRKKKTAKASTDFKRLNKNRPREMSSKRQVPFLGVELRATRKNDDQIRDPRFDENAGTYDTKTFKENYKFLTNVRRKEIAQLRKELSATNDEDERKTIKDAMQRLINKNTEDINWHAKQALLKEEQKEVNKAISEGKQPHYTTKKERRAKELVMQFEKLKKTGKLNKHLEKRRKKNAAKDRKKLNFD